jgi:multidrug efflux pump
VEFANQLRERGLSVREAVLQSSVQRLRPILMTSIATIGGAVPLMLSTGAGAEARNAIGTVIVGGVGLSTLLTTLVVPSIYLLIGGYTRPSNYTAELLEKLRLRERPRPHSHEAGHGKALEPAE